MQQTLKSAHAALKTTQLARFFRSESKLKPQRIVVCKCEISCTSKSTTLESRYSPNTCIFTNFFTSLPQFHPCGSLFSLKRAIAHPRQDWLNHLCHYAFPSPTLKAERDSRVCISVFFGCVCEALSAPTLQIFLGCSCSCMLTHTALPPQSGPMHQAIQLG